LELSEVAYGLVIGGGANTGFVCQTVTGLVPNTTYVAQAWLKTQNGVAVEVGVLDYGGNQRTTWTNSATWNMCAVEFTTGTSNTSALIYLNKINGNGYAYIDDVTVRKKDPNSVPESFETDFVAWTPIPSGTPTAGTVAHDGTKSYKVVQDADAITKTLGASSNKKAAIWFYDDAADISLKTIARVDDGVTTRGLGVNTDTSTQYYSILSGTVWAATTVQRSTGWHKLEWNYTDGSTLYSYIDGTSVYNSTTVKSFKYIAMGDFWSDGKSGTVYYDDLKIYDIDVSPY